MNDGREQLRALLGEDMRDDLLAMIASVNQTAALNRRADELCGAILRGQRTIFTAMLRAEYNNVLDALECEWSKRVPRPRLTAAGWRDGI